MTECKRNRRKICELEKGVTNARNVWCAISVENMY